jgi:hypothetical protein
MSFRSNITINKGRPRSKSNSDSESIGGNEEIKEQPIGFKEIPGEPMFLRELALQ